MNTNIARYSGPFAGPTKGELCDEIDRLQDLHQLQWHVIQTLREDLRRATTHRLQLEERLMRMAEDMAQRERVRIDGLRFPILDRTKVDVEFEPIKYRTFGRESLRCVVEFATPEINTMEEQQPLPDNLVVEVMRKASFEFAKKIDEKLLAFLYTPRQED